MADLSARIARLKEAERQRAVARVGPYYEPSRSGRSRT